MKKNTIKMSDMELDIYKSIFNKSKRLKDEMKKYKTCLSSMDKLSEDIYMLLFKRRYDIEEIENIDSRYILNHKIIREMDTNYDIKSLKKKTEYKYLDSLIATEIIINEIDKFIVNWMEEDIVIRENIRRINLDIEELNKRNIKEYKENIDVLFKSLINSNFFYKVMSNSYKEYIAITSAIKTWGLDDGKLTTESYDEKILVATKLRRLKKVKAISEMTGRFRESASKLQKRRIKEEGQEICGVDIGNEIHKVLPSEKILLANKKTKRSFMKKYVQKELLSYKHRNSNIESKGPIICCIDTSTSMEGEREIWSKSVAMTLLDIAFKQRRDFVAILFSYRVGQVIEFNRNKKEATKIYDLATAFFGSGTNFSEPLTEAIRLINTAKYKYADIVFITDGEAPLDDDFLKEFKENKEKKQFRMISVNVSDEEEQSLNQINDIQILLKELTEDIIDKANETIFSI